ncbi:MAG: hypothetical protein AB1942_03205 [Pseudomonadota bacterium]
MRYFFHTEDGQCFPDEEGSELPDLQSACIEATKALGEFMREKPKAFWEHDCLTLKVADAEGLVLFTLDLSVTLAAAMNGRHPPIV